MDTVHNARAVLVEAEGALRKLMEQSLKEQRYSEVAEIAGLAGGISRLLGSHTPAATASHVAGDAVVLPEARATSPVAKRPGAKPSKSEYPRFERDDDKLVKIGWSKKSKTPYEHKAPRAAVIAFARHLSGTTAEGKVFVVEDLLPVPDVANGGELPSYQVYLALAWLRHLGVVVKKGRDGYVLRSGGLGEGALDGFWTGLPARNT